MAPKTDLKVQKTLIWQIHLVIQVMWQVKLTDRYSKLYTETFGDSGRGISYGMSVSWKSLWSSMSKDCSSIACRHIAVLEQHHQIHTQTLKPTLKRFGAHLLWQRVSTRCHSRWQSLHSLYKWHSLYKNEI